MTPEAWKNRLLDTCLWELIGKEAPPDLSRRILEAARRIESKPRRTFRPVWAAAAAATAIIVGAVVLFAPRREPASPAAVTGAGFLVAAKTGEVEIDAGRLTTEEDSSCRLDFDDGFTVAADQNTTLGWARDDASGVTLLRHEHGRSYVHTKKRNVPLAIRVGDAAIEILGTRLLITRGASDVPIVGVLEGSVRYAHGTTTVRVPKDFVVRSLENRKTGKVLIQSTPLVVEPDSVSWLDKLGVTSGELLRDADAESPGDTRVDLDRFLAFGGNWEIRSDKESPAVIQRSAEGRAEITLGRALWKKGVFTFRFRLVETGPKQPYVGFLLFNTVRTAHQFELGTAMKKIGISKKSGWLCSRTEFEIGPDRRPVVTKHDLWIEKNPRARTVLKNPWIIPGSRASFDACGVGLVTQDCAVEFRDLKVSEIRDGVK